MASWITLTRGRRRKEGAEIVTFTRPAGWRTFTRTFMAAPRHRLAMPGELQCPDCRGWFEVPGMTPGQDGESLGGKLPRFCPLCKRRTLDKSFQARWTKPK